MDIAQNLCAPGSFLHEKTYMSLHKLIEFNLVVSFILISLLIVLFSPVFTTNSTIYICYLLSWSLVYNVLLLSFSKQKVKIKVSVIMFLLFFCSVLFSGFSNYIFYSETQSFFPPNSADAIGYDRIAREATGIDLVEIRSIIPEKWQFDDYGFPIFLTLVYRCIESNLFLNMLYVLLNLIVSFQMVRIGRYFLDQNNAIIASLIYGISSYSIYFQSDGLKEPLMIFLIVSSFYYYVKYVKTEKSIYVVMTIAVSSLLMFFRVPLFLFIIISMIINAINKNKSPILSSAIMIVGTISVLMLVYSLPEIMSGYLRDIDRIKGYSESVFPGGLSPLVVASSIINGLFGPLPTLLPVEGKEKFLIREGGLILKVLLSVPFWLGVYAAIRSKNRYVIPLAAFACMNIFALIYLMQSFDLRKSMPHFPFFVLIAVYGFQVYGRIKLRFLKVNLIYMSSFLLTTLIFAWNYLRLK